DGEQPVDLFGLRLHYRVSSRSWTSGLATTRWKSTPATITISGGSVTSHQKPWWYGGSRVTRQGCRKAQTIPARMASGPIASTASARLEWRVRESSVAYWVT